MIIVKRIKELVNKKAGDLTIKELEEINEYFKIVVTKDNSKMNLYIYLGDNENEFYVYRSFSFEDSVKCAVGKINITKLYKVINDILLDS